MALLDRLLGTRHPAPDVVPANADHLRTELLGLNGRGAAWRIREGSAQQVDLVAEWSAESGMNVYHLEILIRLDETRHVALALDRLSTASDAGGGAQFDQGNITRHAVGWTLERDEDGRRQLVRDADFNIRALKEPLRATVTAHGWTWRGRLRRP